MKFMYCLLLILCPFPGKSQATGIGDVVPDIAFTQLVNGEPVRSSLARYKGRLLVCCFIQTTCAACIKTLPGIDSLQRTFGKDMQVLLVTSQTQAAIQKFLQHNPVGKQLSLPIVYADTALRSLFPYEYISHLVWIGPDGTVKAITGSEYFTGTNIRKAIQHTTLGWPVKNDLPQPGIATPFLQWNNQKLPAVAKPAAHYYTAFYRNMPGMPAGMFRFTDSSTATGKTLLLNQSVPDLYRKLFGKTKIPLSHILLQLQPKELFVYNDSFFLAGWEQYNSFCYEAVQPLFFTEQQSLQQMLNDIGRYTNTAAYLIDTIIAGYTLKDTGTASLPLLSHRPADSAVLSMSGLLYSLNNSYGAPPVSDGRQHKQQAWLPANDKLDFTSINALNRLLMPYGLVLQAQPQKLQALVITQTGTYPFMNTPKLYTK